MSDPLSMPSGHLIPPGAQVGKAAKGLSYCPSSCHVTRMDFYLLDLDSWATRSAPCAWIRAEMLDWSFKEDFMGLGPALSSRARPYLWVAKPSGHHIFIYK